MHEQVVRVLAMAIEVLLVHLRAHQVCQRRADQVMVWVVRLFQVRQR
jgi:hypothetical protein